MNGTGMMVWENVFGTWVGWSPRDRSLYRSMLPVQRRFVRLFSGEGWTPLVGGARQDGLYASLWEDSGVRLWTLVNRREAAVHGDLLAIEPRQGERVFDLIAGREAEGNADGMLRGTVGPRGVGGFVAARREALGSDFEAFLAKQRRLHAAANSSTEFPARPTTLKPVEHRPQAVFPEGMIAIPAAGFHMRSQFRIREPGFYESTHPYFTGGGSRKLHVPIWFERDVQIGRFAIDATPVTNAEFARFLKASGYKPRHAQNFLRHWTGGKPPAGQEDHPVIWVDLGDARAYAAWAGKRLPTEEEWQYAAQGTDGRQWPWGGAFDVSRCNGGASGGTTPVKAYPEGRSPFGVYDLCGNTWEWTESERTDGRTRFAILRGGSWYDPKGSYWYMDGGPRPVNFAAKFLMMWPGLDRCGTVGFRCVLDLA
jgi:formylglycine-generating enzyme required for sulfatase activity